MLGPDARMPKREVAGRWGWRVAVLMSAAASGRLYKWRDTASQKGLSSLLRLILTKTHMRSEYCGDRRDRRGVVRP